MKCSRLTCVYEIQKTYHTTAESNSYDNTVLKNVEKKSSTTQVFDRFCM